MGLVIEIRRLIRTLHPHPGPGPLGVQQNAASRPDGSSKLVDGTSERTDDEPARDKGHAPGDSSALVTADLVDALLPAARRDASARRDPQAQGGALPALDTAGSGTGLDTAPSMTRAEGGSSVAPTQREAHDREASRAAHLEAVTELAEGLSLGFHLGAAVERIADAASRGRDGIPQLREAIWMIERYVALVEQRPIGADLHAASVRLSRTGDAIAELRALTAALVDDVPPAPSNVESPADPTSAPQAETLVAAERASTRWSRPDSLARELTRMAVQSTILVTALVAAVLALTLIGDWR